VARFEIPEDWVVRRIGSRWIPRRARSRNCSCRSAGVPRFAYNTMLAVKAKLDQRAAERVRMAS
jgi:hypothetical protein